MKKNMTKYAVAAMAAMMISGALTACGGSDKKAETTVAVETTVEETSAEVASEEETTAEAADEETTEAAAEESTEAEAADASLEVEETTAAN